MTEIEPTIENVKLGDVVVIESGTPDSPGWVATAHKVSDRGGFCPITIEHLAHNLSDGKRLTKITRPAPPIPTTPGERFWARMRSADPREYIVTDEQAIVHLDSGTQWERGLFERNHTVVPAPEPETVPVPADLIREAEEWIGGMASRSAVGILSRIVLAARDLEGES